MKCTEMELVKVNCNSQKKYTSDFKTCPLGFSLVNSLCDCNILLSIPRVQCDIQSETITRDGSVWVGVYHNQSVAVSQYCPLYYCKNESVHIHLQSNDTHSQCNFRHSGVLCGECQSGLSLSLGSETCLPCTNTYILLVVPFAMAGFVFVSFIKFLDLTVSHGTINGAIFYATIIGANKHLFYSQTAINPITLFIAWFNFDLGIETCFYDGLTAYARTWLQFVFPVYMWCIAGGIIILAKYSKKVAALSGNNGVPVLATIFLLSYAKLLNTILSVVSYTTLHTSDGPKRVWSVDGNIEYLGPKHAPLFAVAVAVLLLLWLPYSLLHLCGRCLHRINSHFLTRTLLRLKPFLDANYAPFNDRHQYWFGVTLTIKATVLLASATAPANSDRIAVFSVSVASVVLTFWGQMVYKNSATALLSTSFFMNLAVLNIPNLIVFGDHKNNSIASFVLIAILLATLTGSELFKLYHFFPRKFNVKSCFKRNRMRREETERDMVVMVALDDIQDGSDCDSNCSENGEEAF